MLYVELLVATPSAEHSMYHFSNMRVRLHTLSNIIINNNSNDVMA